MSDEAKRCATCRHWRHIRDEDYAFMDGGVEVTWQGPHGECHRIWDPDDRVAWISESKVPIDPHEPMEGNVGFEASLITQPDFGCVLHEPRDAAA